MSGLHLDRKDLQDHYDPSKILCRCEEAVNDNGNLLVAAAEDKD